MNKQSEEGVSQPLALLFTGKWQIKDFQPRCCVMVILDVPLHPDLPGIWRVAFEGSVQEFGSRALLLAFAAAKAKSMARRGAQVFLNIEGEDGIWRLFDSELRGLLKTAPSA